MQNDTSASNEQKQVVPHGNMEQHPTNDDDDDNVKKDNFLDHRLVLSLRLMMLLPLAERAAGDLDAMYCATASPIQAKQAAVRALVQSGYLCK